MIQSFLEVPFSVDTRIYLSYFLNIVHVNELLLSVDQEYGLRNNLYCMTDLVDVNVWLMV